MTSERAAEILLGGPQWVDCDECRGAGSLLYGNVRDHCSECDGSGKMLTEEYVAACDTLEVSHPILPVLPIVNISPAFESTMTKEEFDDLISYGQLCVEDD